MSRQQDILDFIARHNRERGYSPTIREIGDAVGLKSSSSVHGHIERLEKRGLIKKTPSSPRTIDVTYKQLANDTTVVLGRRRVAVKVLEIAEDGTFKKLLIGNKRYLLDPMG